VVALVALVALWPSQLREKSAFLAEPARAQFRHEDQSSRSLAWARILKGQRVFGGGGPGWDGV
jgi:hypothetical protein